MVLKFLKPFYVIDNDVLIVLQSTRTPDKVENRANHFLVSAPKGNVAQCCSLVVEKGHKLQ